MFRFLNKNKKYLFIVSGFLIALGIYFCINILSGKAVDSGDRIHFVSSKEGDGIIIESNGHCGLVDALDPASYNSVSNSNTCDLTPTDTSSLGNGSTLKTYAENIGCDHFDFVIMTHSHKDHIGGIPLLKDMFNENTIVFYKEDLTSSDDYEENKDCGVNDNHGYQQRALAAFAEKNSILCDVTKASDITDPRCNLSSLSNDVIPSVSYNDNDTFVGTDFGGGVIGYDTNIRNTLLFNFGDFRINLYSLYNLSTHQENLNSIITLVTHKNGEGTAALTGDIFMGPTDEDNEHISSLSSIISNPTGSCYKCTVVGIENQVADVVRSVDVLKASNHGLENSNSIYSLNVYQPRFYITTGGNVNSDLYQSNIAAITYLKNTYQTKSYLSSEATGAVVAQFNDDYNNNLTILNYNADGTQSNDTLTDISTIVYKDINDNYLDGKKSIRNEDLYNNEYVYIKDGRPIVNDWVTVTESNETKTYHAKENGLLNLGFSDPINDNVFYFSDFADEHDGEMLTGLNMVQKDGNFYLYYFREEPDIQNAKPVGTYVTGLQTINDKTYYFIEEDDEHFEGPAGSAISGFVELNGYNYYFYEDDSIDGFYMAKNTYVQDTSGESPVTYYADANGHSTSTAENIAFIPNSDSCIGAIYNGEEKMLAEDGNGYTVTDNTATNVGTYTVTAHLESGYKWNDNSTGNKTFECTVEKAQANINETEIVENVDVGYSGDLVTFETDTAGRYLFSSDGTHIEITTPIIDVAANEGATLRINAINSGTSYIDVTFIPTDTSNYNATQYRKTIIVGDGGTVAVIPTAKSYCRDISYNGHEQVLTNDPGRGYTFINNTGTNAADYTVTARLNQGYTWTDNTTEDKILTCTIEAYDPIITTSAINQNIFVGSTDTLMTISSDVPGTFTYTSSDNVSLESTQDIVSAGSTRNIVVTGLSAGNAYVQADFVPSVANTYSTWTKVYFDVRTASVPYPTSDYLCKKNLVYNGSAQTIASTDNEYITLINTTGTNAGDYTVTARLSQPDTQWPDGTTTDKTFVCSIGKATPVITKNITYSQVSKDYSGSIGTLTANVAGRYVLSADGEHIKVTNLTIDVNPNQSIDININASQTGEGSIGISFIPTDTTNYTGVEDTLNITVTTNNLIAAIPTADQYCKNSLVYSGSEQTLTKANGEGYTFSNNTGTNAGDYNVTAALESGYEWSDGTTADKTITCNIAKYTPVITRTNEIDEITIGTSPTVMTISSDVPGVFTYTGDEYVTPSGTGFFIPGSTIDVTALGIKSGSGNITVLFTPENSTNINTYEFTKSIIVSKVSVAIPTADTYCKNDLVYNKYAQTLTNEPATGYTFSNNSGTNAGSYNVTATLNDGYEWSDKTTADKTITCSIAKADPVLVINSINTDNISQFSTTDIMSFIPDLAGVFTFNAGNTIITNYNSEITVNKNEAAVFAGTGSNVGTTSLVVTFVPTNTNYNSFTHSYNITVVENSEHVVDIPTSTSSCKLDLVYNGSEKVLTVDDTEAYEFINNTATNAGTYDVTVRLKGDYKWSDTTTTDKTVVCSIGKASLEEPTITGYSGTYDGNPHTVTVSNLNGGSARYSLDNTIWTTEAPTATDAGTTQVFVKIIGDDNHNDSSVYTTNIIINKANPVLSTLNLSPNVDEGETAEVGPISSDVAGTITLASADESILIVPTLPAALPVGEAVKFPITGVKDGETTYTLTFTPSSNNYNPKVITSTVVVNKPMIPPVAIPTAENYCKANLKYTGSALTITNEPATGYTFSNNVQTNVGTYTVTAKLQDGYTWEDNTTTDKTFNCLILQGDSYLNLNSKLIINNGYMRVNSNPPVTYIKLKSLIDTNGVISHTKADADNVATCDTLSINLGGVISNYILILPGDITKNGLAEQADVTLLFNYLRGKSSLNTCQLKASDVTNDNGVHINDVAKLYQFVNNKIEGLGE